MKLLARAQFLAFQAFGQQALGVDDRTYAQHLLELVAELAPDMVTCAEADDDDDDVGVMVN